MKVDFDKLKREVSLPDFFLHLGWKFVEGSSNSSPKLSTAPKLLSLKKTKKTSIPIGTFTMMKLVVKQS